MYEYLIGKCIDFVSIFNTSCTHGYTIEEVFASVKEDRPMRCQKCGDEDIVGYEKSKKE